MNLKRLAAGAIVAGALGAAAMGAGTGVAYADPSWPHNPGGHGDHGRGGPGGPGPWRGNPQRGYFNGAPWGNGAAPWGWGEPPRAGWRGPLPPAGGRWTGGPINYWGYQQTPIWNQGFNQWGFWLFGVWIPL